MLLLALVGCTADTSTVHLTFGEPVSATAGGTPLAFRCMDDASNFLATRAVTGSGANRRLEVSFIVDFISLGGLPTCRPTDIARWCADPMHKCQVISDDANAPRICIPKSKSLGVLESAVSAMGDLLDLLKGLSITGDAPHEPVMVRVVGTAQTCDEVANGSYDLAKLVGCAISCPVQLDSVDGDVLLDLPTLVAKCEPDVDACAQAMFNP